LAAPQQFFLGAFFILAKQERGLFTPLCGVLLFHSATGGTGGFFLADFPPFAFFRSVQFSGFSVGLFGLVGSLGSASDFWGFLLLIA